MLDIQLIRRDPEYVAQALAKREYYVDFTAFIESDRERREHMTELEQ
ncbi:MAG: serine--tRNA ligase, partial [Clostridia bacterium]|nr:serine--tRNA ligase [Clostridia bacterium]